MLTYEKLSDRPESFRRLTGVDIDLFRRMTEKIQPLRGERRNNFGKSGRKSEKKSGQSAEAVSFAGGLIQ